MFQQQYHNESQQQDYSTMMPNQHLAAASQQQQQIRLNPNANQWQHPQYHQQYQPSTTYPHSIHPNNNTSLQTAPPWSVANTNTNNTLHPIYTKQSPNQHGQQIIPPGLGQMPPFNHQQQVIYTKNN
jgi:hypothetical protein